MKVGDLKMNIEDFFMEKITEAHGEDMKVE
jgi:hypothetical protein